MSAYLGTENLPGDQRGQKRVLNPLELKYRCVRASEPQTWNMLGTKHGSSTRAASARNPSIISSVPSILFLFKLVNNDLCPVLKEEIVKE